MIPTAFIAAIALAVFLYSADYHRADERAEKALQSDEVVIEKTDYGWFFDGPAEDAVLVFYPGGKVEETAYAPLLHRLAEREMDVCLIKMPLHLAVLDMNAADDLRNRYDYENWYIGGHSLGGAVAANYAAVHDLDGVILLASYPTKAVDEPMLLLYGSEDGVLNRERVEKAGQYGEITEVVIEGGNHAGFGDYGRQKGDNGAGISREEQQQAVLDAVENWLKGKSVKD